MTLDDIKQMARPELIATWEALPAGLPDIPPGRGFEILILRAFEMEGALVEWPFEVRDPYLSDNETLEQFDGAIYSDSLACLVEAKDQSENVQYEPLAKLAGRLGRRPRPTVGMVFSRTNFTDPAKTAARFLVKHPILLWTGTEFDYAVRHGVCRPSLLTKYRKAIEKGMPDFDIVTGATA